MGERGEIIFQENIHPCVTRSGLSDPIYILDFIELPIEE